MIPLVLESLQKLIWVLEIKVSKEIFQELYAAIENFETKVIEGKEKAILICKSSEHKFVS